MLTQCLDDLEHETFVIKYQRISQNLVSIILFIVQKPMQQSSTKTSLVSDFVIVGLSPELALKQSHQNHFITSISITSTPKVISPSEKILQLSDGMFLRAIYGQKSKPAIAEIEIFECNHHAKQWLPVQQPSEYQISGQAIYYRIVQQKSFERKIEDVSILKFGQYSSVCSFAPQMKEKQRFVKLPSSEDYLVIHYSEKMSLMDMKYKAEILQRYPINQYSVYLQTLAQYCFPNGVQISNQCIPYRIFNFILTPETGERLYCTCLESTEQCSKQLSGVLKSFENSKTNYFYCEKVYIIISKYKYVDQFSESLQNMYLYSMHSSIHESCSMKDLIRNFVDGLIVPQDSEKSGIKNKVGSKQTIFDTDLTRPHSADRAIYALFKIMDNHNILKIFKAMLLQKNIFLISSSKTILGLVTQALLDLIFPFRWEHALIPILPQHLTHFIQSPIPIIAGLSPQTVDQRFESLGLLVYLDSNIVNGDHFLHSVKFGKEQNILKKSLKNHNIYCHNAVFQFFQSNQNPSFFRFKKGNIKFEPFELSKIKNSFLLFLRQTVKQYQHFVAKKQVFQQKDCIQNESRSSLQTRSSKQRKSFDNIFGMKQFRSKHKLQNKKEFGFMFTETSMFCTFIERYYQNPGDMQFAFFNNESYFEQECGNNERFSCVLCVSKQAEQIIQRSLSLQHMLSKQSSIDEPSVKNWDEFQNLNQIENEFGNNWENWVRKQSQGKQGQRYIEIKDQFEIVDEQSFYKCYLDRVQQQRQEECLSPVIDQSTLIENNLCFTKSNRIQQIEKTLINNRIISMLEQHKLELPLKTKNRQKLADIFPALQPNQILFNTIEDVAYNQSVLSEPLLNPQHPHRLTWAQWVCRNFGCITLTAARLKQGVSQLLVRKNKQMRPQKLRQEHI